MKIYYDIEEMEEKWTEIPDKLMRYGVHRLLTKYKHLLRTMDHVHTPPPRKIRSPGYYSRVAD